MNKKYSDNDWEKKNLSHKKLQGLNFQGKNLEGFNFEKAYIQGVNFSGANLKDANFKGAEAGLERGWTLVVLSILFLLASLLVICLIIAGQIAGDRMIPKHNPGIYPDVFWEEIWVAIIIILFFIIFIFNVIRNRLETAFLAMLISGIIIISLRLVNALVQFILEVPFRNITVSLTSSVLAAVVGFGIGFVAVAMAIAISMTKIIGGKIAYFIVLLGAFLTTLPTTLFLYKSGVHIVSSIIGACLAGFGIMLANYIANCAFSQEKKYPIVMRIAVFLAATGGTNFSDADLTNADFTEAILKNTDFQGAILTRTRWLYAKQLNLSRSERTYLQNSTVQQLVVTGYGKDKNFDRLDLGGLDLHGANLENASFIDADFYQANLSGANLSRAILVRTNFERAIIKGACLTGSCIQDWIISKESKLDGIICDYVYLKLVNKDKRDIQPHRGNFPKGGFVLFAKYLLDTIDLYHKRDINPRLALTVLKKMSRDYDEPLDIVAVGKRGDKVFMKIKLSEKIESEEFQEQYYSKYDKGLELISSSSQNLPAVDEIVENKLAEIASDKEINENSSINITYTNVEYLNASKDLIIQGEEFTVETIDTRGDTFYQSGSFGIGVNKGEVHAEKIAGIINETEYIKPNKSSVKTILILAANPKNTSRLRLDEEVREIDAGLQRAKKRELFELKQCWAVRIQDVYQSLLDFKPQIVHFSCHGSGDDGLILEDETGKTCLVDNVTMTELFKLFADNIECVVLNACYSEVQAMAIVKHIPYVIGMNKQIGDQAAIKFATGFYSALGAGESIEFAYKLGCNVIQLDGIPEYLTPVLKKA